MRRLRENTRTTTSRRTEKGTYRRLGVPIFAAHILTTNGLRPQRVLDFRDDSDGDMHDLKTLMLKDHCVLQKSPVRVRLAASRWVLSEDAAWDVGNAPAAYDVLLHRGTSGKRHLAVFSQRALSTRPTCISSRTSTCSSSSLDGIQMEDDDAGPAEDALRCTPGRPMAWPRRPSSVRSRANTSVRRLSSERDEDHGVALSLP